MKDLFGNDIDIKIKRKYFHYLLWEDYQNGMYAIIQDNQEKEKQVLKAIELLSNKDKCFKAMSKVIDEWQICTYHNLSNLEQNRKAWLGQAACNITENINEECTRLAWCRMTKENQDQANKIANDIIKGWENAKGL